MFWVIVQLTQALTVVSRALFVNNPGRVLRGSNAGLGIAMMNGNGTSAHLPVVDGENYDAWCIQMKVIFGMQDVLDIVMAGLQSLKKMQAKHKKECSENPRSLIVRLFSSSTSVCTLKILPRLLRLHQPSKPGISL